MLWVRVPPEALVLRALTIGAYILAQSEEASDQTQSDTGSSPVLFLARREAPKTRAKGRT